jgi:HPt (histidine-containing phosphotransfer) domain-containing protein
MTAHAMQEERERCLALGMLQHITKPLDPALLYEALAPYVRPAPPVVPLAVATPPRAPAGLLTQSAALSGWADLPSLQGVLAPPPTPPVRPASALPEIEGLQVHLALSRFEGDVAFYTRTLQSFVTHARHMGATLRRALQEGLWPDLVREAHTLKGLAGTIGHDGLAVQSALLESAAMAVKSQGTALVAEAIDAVADELDRLLPALDAHLAAQAPAEPPSGLASGAQPQHPATAEDMALAARLRHLAAECDSEALALWQRHRADFAAWMPPMTTARLASALERCDFDSAFGLLTDVSTAGAASPGVDTAPTA